jgi:CubicO group peptidase (beta-lactamase class C family)
MSALAAAGLVAAAATLCGPLAGLDADALRAVCDVPAVAESCARARQRSEPALAARASRWPEQLQRVSPSVSLGGESRSFDEALLATHTNALLVVRDRVIVYERYLNGSDAQTRFASWSIAKSITSVLMGIAIDRGLIRSVGEPVERYLPELAVTAFEGVTIEQLLMMRDGTNYTEQLPDGPSTLDVVKMRSTYGHCTRFTDVSGLDLRRVTPPGSRFVYSTLSSGLLGLIEERATGQTLARFTEAALWKPAGMQADAFWILDGPASDGRALAGGGFNATARVGQMMLDHGRINGRQIVSRDWVSRSTRYAGREPVIPGAPRGYQYQWWTMIGTDRFEAIGIHGQFLSIDPATRTVIVKLSHWPQIGGLRLNQDTWALLQAVRDAVGSGRIPAAAP